QLLAVDLDLGARPLAEQHAVTRLELDCDQLAGFVAAAGTDGDHFAFARLFLGGVGDDDAAFGLLLGGDAAHDHAVVQRAELGLGHGFLVGASRAGHYRKCCFDKRLALRRESANRCRGDIGSPPTCQAEAAAGCLRRDGLVYDVGGATVDGALALAVIAPQSRPRPQQGAAMPRLRPALPHVLTLALLALALGACSTTSPFGPRHEEAPPQPAVLPTLPPAFPPQDLVGRWGLAAYHKDEDRPRIEAAAAQQCANPYLISMGPTGGVMMHLADQATPTELRLKGAPGGKTYVGPAEDPPASMQDREVVHFDGRILILRWMD